MSVKKIAFNNDRLSRKEAADYLGLALATLEIWASTGRYNLPFIKIGRRVYYRRSDLDAFIEQRTVHPSPTRSQAHK